MIVSDDRYRRGIEHAQLLWLNLDLNTRLLIVIIVGFISSA